MGDPASSNEQSPIVIFTKMGAGDQNEVILIVTDTNGNSCPKTVLVGTTLPLPEWKEVGPF